VYNATKLMNTVNRL